MKRKHITTLVSNTGRALMRRISPISVSPLVPHTPIMLAPDGTQELSTDASSDTKPRPVRRLLVGLGNPGVQYQMTRHNVGFMVLEHLTTNMFPELLQDGIGADSVQFAMNTKLNSKMAAANLVFRSESALGLDLVDSRSERRHTRTAEEGVPYPLVDANLMLPQTFMNLSGTPVRKFIDQQKYRLKKNPMALNRGDEIIVVADDVSLPFGEIRLKAKGGDGGHNGIKDISKRLGMNRYARLRVGVGPQDGGGIVNLSKHVLGKFNHAEQERLMVLVAHASECLRVYLFRGVQAASEVTNGKHIFDNKMGAAGATKSAKANAGGSGDSNSSPAASPL